MILRHPLLSSPRVRRALAGAALLCVLAPGAHGVETKPDELIRTTTSEVIALVSRDSALDAGQAAATARMVEARVLPHFDFRRMTQLAVGRDWQRASEPQREALIDGFRSLLVRTYSTALGQVKNRSVEVKPPLAAAPDEATVKTVVRGPGSAAPVALDYRMHRTGDGWKVYDVALEGVSLVTTYRSTFAEEIQRGGIEGLIDRLARRNGAR